MALIEKKFVADREAATYKLDRAMVELVRFYAEFIGSPQEHVVNEALRYLFRKDKEFNTWLAARGHAAPDPLGPDKGGQTSGARSKAAAAPAKSDLS